MDTSVTALRVFETDRSAVEAELTHLLNDRKFSSAPQMSAFLRYVVLQTLDGNGGRIKAYTVGVDALGKPYTFDAQTDPSVRVLALRLRKTLAVVYEANPQRHVQIEFKVGSYIPEFVKVAPSPPPRMASKSDSPLHERLKRDGSSSPQAACALPESLCLDTPQARASESADSPSGLSHKMYRSMGGHIAYESLSKHWLLLSVLFIFLCIWLMRGALHGRDSQQLWAKMSLPLVGLDSAWVATDSSTTAQQLIPAWFLLDDHPYDCG